MDYLGTAHLLLRNQRKNGPKSMRDMLNLPDSLTPFSSLFCDYKMHLLEVAKIENLDSYSNDLKLLFGFVKYQNEKELLKKFVNENADCFKEISPETGYVIESVAHVPEFGKYIEKNIDQERGTVDMCKAIDDMIKEKNMEIQAELKSTKIELENHAKLLQLIQLLLGEKSFDLASKVSFDAELRNKLYSKYKLI